MKSVKLAALAASTIFLPTLAHAVQTVLSFDVLTSLDIEYSSTPFDLQAYSGITNESDFLAEYPVAGMLPGASSSDYDVYGFSSHAYRFIEDFVSPTFSSSATYFWSIDVDFGYQTTFKPTGGSSTSIGDSGTQHQEGFATLNSIANFLFGIPPTNLGAIGSSIPPSGPLADLVANTGDFTVQSHDWLTSTGYLGPDAFFTYSSTGPVLPSGEIQIAMGSPIVGLDEATSSRFSNVIITAIRVSDSGSTSLMAIVGMGILLLAKRRIVR